MYNILVLIELFLKGDMWLMYEHFFKRLIDFMVSLLAIVILSPVLLLLMVIGAIAMQGNPFFVQPRPGRKRKNPDGTFEDETIFNMVKFRSMTNAKDKKTGRLLPDEKRLTGYGKFIRNTSLDELPELFDVLSGKMSLVGPRPLLVKDMVFMTKEQRRRHNVRPGVTGLAQVNGRNGISWEDKLAFDVKYVDNVTFLNDIKILLKTVAVVFGRKGVNKEGMATAEDFGDYLLRENKISSEEYNELVKNSKEILDQRTK